MISRKAKANIFFSDLNAEQREILFVHLLVLNSRNTLQLRIRFILNAYICLIQKNERIPEILVLR